MDVVIIFIVGGIIMYLWCRFLEYLWGMKK